MQQRLLQPSFDAVANATVAANRCGPCYTDEVMAFSAAVRKHPKPLVLSYSPGGGNTVEAGRWVAGQATAPTPGGEGVTGVPCRRLGQRSCPVLEAMGPDGYLSVRGVSIGTGGGD